MNTKAPSSTNRFAVAKPIPVVPPVTTATFPCNLPIYRRSILQLKLITAGVAAPGGRPLSAAFEISDLAPSRAIIRDGLAVMPRSSSSRARSQVLDPCSDRSRRVAVESPVEVLGDKSDMRCREKILEGSERVRRRQ